MSETQEKPLEPEIQINQVEYEKFKKSFKLMVFDQDGNYLYTKAAEEDTTQET